MERGSAGGRERAASISLSRLLRRIPTAIASPSTMQERLIGLYRERFGQAPSAVLALAGDGSNRAYRRLLGSGNAAIIGVMGQDHEENRAFL